MSKTSFAFEERWIALSTCIMGHTGEEQETGGSYTFEGSKDDLGLGQWLVLSISDLYGMLTLEEPV